MDSQETVGRLADLGFSEYEAKAYIALIRKYPSTAYEVAKSSGVPSSKIYEVLHRLEEKGIILPIDESDGKRKRYIPKSPEEFLAGYETETTKIIRVLKEDFKAIHGGRGVSYIWNVADREQLLIKARGMIEAAEKVLLLSIWADELQLLEGELKDAERRGVRIALVHFGAPQRRIGQLYHHPIEDTLFEEKGGRALVIVADSREVLIGMVGEDGRTEGAWSRNRGFVMIAEDYVKHDIYIIKMIDRFGPELIRTFGERYAKLRDVLRDEVEPKASDMEGVR